MTEKLNNNSVSEGSGVNEIIIRNALLILLGLGATGCGAYLTKADFEDVRKMYGEYSALLKRNTEESKKEIAEIGARKDLKPEQYPDRMEVLEIDGDSCVGEIIHFRQIHGASNIEGQPEERKKAVAEYQRKIFEELKRIRPKYIFAEMCVNNDADNCNEIVKSPSDKSIVSNTFKSRKGVDDEAEIDQLFYISGASYVYASLYSDETTMMTVGSKDTHGKQADIMKYKSILSDKASRINERMNEGRKNKTLSQDEIDRMYQDIDDILDKIAKLQEEFDLLSFERERVYKNIRAVRKRAPRRNSSSYIRSQS